ncbi:MULTISPECIES: flagellin [unclassified Pseudoalteromonas]|uniref:flagellin n=1 Tax=Pseudoalteromonas sp. Angola-4 TaxID=3025335 RepID=UPI00235863CC|nr:flagellin [Pseudoalteromonas sp. Angola-4]MDC9510469.1 flagellin [Pseudoalteromonas sp. Angola-4]MDC9521073.1 flagellin [Pseudoalteromonas sp. Angola-31]
MMISVNTNVSSLNAQRNLSTSGSDLATSMERLSSGMRINSAKDDAAGLQISNRLTSQVNGLAVAQRNANDGISMAQTAEGAMSESTSILQRMRELALQSANGSNSTEDRESLQKEVSALQTELTRIAETTSFGGQQLLDGSFGSKSFQIGANANENINVSLSSVAANKIGTNQINLQGDTAGFAEAFAGTASQVTGGNLVIDGRESATVAIAAGASAADAASAVNSYTSSTGVTAQARSEAKVDITTAGDADEIISFELNGKDLASGDEIKVSFVSTGTVAGDKQAMAEAINAKTDEHGVTAKIENGELTIGNDTGEDIVLSKLAESDGTTSTVGMTVTGKSYDGVDATTPVAIAAGDDVHVSGSLQLNSSEVFTAQTTDTTIAATANTEVSSLKSVDSIDITDQQGSQDAIAIIDNAIANIDSQRASLGAVQNRFDHTISNLANIEENVSASRSRIQDTDFATETAEMTKNQILQQAGTSILSQANQLPQTALSLLG